MSEHINKVSLHPEQKKWKAPKGPKPIQHKSKNAIGLGRTIANQRRMENEMYFLPNGEMRFTTDKKEADWVKMRSVTQENSLDEFLNTAQMADTDFTASKENQVKIIKVGGKMVNGNEDNGLLSAAESSVLEIKHNEFENKLTVPRRPPWQKGQSKLEIERQENLAFLDWRRELANLTDNSDLLLTPFERNLEVWRQLWRVIERCDLIVQIVDARNPLLFRSVDLVKYVDELSDPDNNGAKKNLLLVNKADLLTLEQRQAWSEFFVEKSINYVFFSAAKANELLEKQLQELEAREPEAQTESKVFERDCNKEGDSDLNQTASYFDPKTRIQTVSELEDLFIKEAPTFENDPQYPNRKTLIGLVGYPNVGKSSTINALVGAKKVSVSSTPGKTKHFQTIHLTDDILLYDCPGLVFPNFAYSKAELVCNGILPIDQLREYVAPVSLVTQRVPNYFLEAVYGINIPIKKVEDGGNGAYASARELLQAYAKARGYVTQGFGSADEPRTARYILKDYVNGKLLCVNPPPVHDDGRWRLATIEELRDFNSNHYSLSGLPENRQSQIISSAVQKGIDMEEFDLSKHLDSFTFSLHRTDNTDVPRLLHGLESDSAHLDRDFFALNDVDSKSTLPFHKQSGTMGNKKHNKKNKKSLKKLRVQN